MSTTDSHDHVHLGAVELPIDPTIHATVAALTQSLEEGRLDAEALGRLRVALRQARERARVRRAQFLLERLGGTDLDEGEVALSLTAETISALGEVSRVAAPAFTVCTGAEVWDRVPGAIQPTLLRRVDGKALLYPGRSHTLAGEPGSGKSMLAQSLSVAELAAGRSVVYIDWEDSAEGVVSRLRLLGGTRQDARRFFYVRVDTSRMEEALAEALTLIAREQPSVVIADGTAQALAAAGLDENSNSDVSLWAAVFVRPICELGAAVLSLDHVSKASAGGGFGTAPGYARGGSAKLADVTGAAYVLRVLEAFCATEAGMAALDLAKDRLGEVGSRGETVALVRFTPAAAPATRDEAHPSEGGLAVYLDVPTPSEARLLAAIMNAVPAAGSVGKTQLKAAAGGNGQRTGQLIDALVAAGFLIAEQFGRRIELRRGRPFTSDDAGTVLRSGTSPGVVE